VLAQGGERRLASSAHELRPLAIVEELLVEAGPGDLPVGHRLDQEGAGLTAQPGQVLTGGWACRSDGSGRSPRRTASRNLASARMALAMSRAPTTTLKYCRTRKMSSAAPEALRACLLSVVATAIASAVIVHRQPCHPARGEGDFRPSPHSGHGLGSPGPMALPRCAGLTPSGTGPMAVAGLP